MPKAKILLVGDYPPPYGGVSVQLFELQRYLSQMSCYNCKVLNIGESRKVKSHEYISVLGYVDFLVKIVLYAARQYTIHLVTNGHNLKSWLCSFVCALSGALNRRKTILVYGSGLAPEYIQKAGLLLRPVIRISLILAGAVLCRNEKMKRTLLSLGIPEKKITIVPGFLGISAIKPEKIPDEITRFLTSHDPVIGSIATLEPEYGIPLVMAALKEVHKIYPSIGLILIGPGKEKKAEISGDGELKEILFLAGSLPHDITLAVMSNLSVFLRASYFDGDSNSVREALTLGVPVVASNTDFRPAGVICFQKGNVSDLVKKLNDTLNSLEEIKRQIPKTDLSVDGKRILDIYKRVNGIYKKL